MKLSRQASNSSPGEFMSNLQTWECRHTAGGPGSAREGAAPQPGKAPAARAGGSSRPGPAAPQQRRPRHTPSFLSASHYGHSNCFIYHLLCLRTAGESQGKHQSIGKQELATRSCTECSVLQHVLMPEGLAETCHEPKEYPKAFPVYLRNA